MVSNELLEKFKKLYQEKYDIELSDEEATEMATNLVNMMKILVRPIHKSKVKEEPEEKRRQNETQQQFSFK